MSRVDELNKHQQSNYLIISLDVELNGVLREKNISYFHVPLTIKTAADRARLWICRGFMWHIILNFGFNMLHLDADAMILKNPFDMIDRNLDINFTQGTAHPLKAYFKWKFVIKCGLFYCKSNNKTIDFFRELINYIIKQRDDQVGLNNLLCDRRVAWKINPTDTYRIRSRNTLIQCCRVPFYGEISNGLNIVVLPHHLFPRVRHETNTPYVIDYLY